MYLNSLGSRASFRHVSTVLLLAIIAQLHSPGAEAEWHRESAAIMGTNIAVELWSEDSTTGREAVDAVIEEMHRINRSMSTYRDDSEITRVNQLAAQAPVSIGQELFDLLAYSLELSELTGGAFDITYASVGYMYDYRKGQRPDQTAIATALPAVDYRHVHLDPETRTVEFGREGVKIDLGGIAKGHAVDGAVELLRRRGIRHAIVSAGGDSRILGDRRGQPWIVGIRDPRNRNKVITRIPLIDEAISTSGDYERYFEEPDGVRYHHIISPSTGDSARSVRSATIIGPNAVLTDGLSTSVFVLGVEKGLELIDSLPECEVVIVDPEGKLFYSSGLTEPDADG